MKINNNIFFYSKDVKKRKIKGIRKKYKKRFKKRFNKRIYNIKKIIFGKFIIVIILIIIYFSIYRNTVNRIHNFNLKLKIKNIDNILNYSMKYDEYDETINENYKYLQNYFCENQNENMNQEFENKIKIAKVNFNEITFDMYVYNKDDSVSNSIINSHQFEGSYTKEFLKALEFYSKKKQLENKNIYFIDIGANVGWYTFFIGKYGYKILSFEASKINNYILYKNYCLNKDVNLTIINKGLDEEDKICILKTAYKNIGNGAVFCENREKEYSDFRADIYNNIELTKLSRYMKFLSKKNVALMKIDVEGNEGKIIKGGEEIITKYHIPFIMMEFYLKMFQFHQTDVLEFLKFFENNGYKFSYVGFFSKNYVSSEELMKNKNSSLLLI